MKSNDALVETCWRARCRQTGRVLACLIVRTARGLEVSVGYSADDLLHTTLIRDTEHPLVAARSHATTLLRALPAPCCEEL